MLPQERGTDASHVHQQHEKVHWAVILYAALLRQAFAHCGKFLTAAHKKRTAQRSSEQALGKRMAC